MLFNHGKWIIARTTKSRNLTAKELSIEEFFVRKIKATPQVNLFWSERFSENKRLLDESIVYSPINDFVKKDCEN